LSVAVVPIVLFPKDVTVAPFNICNAFGAPQKEFPLIKAELGAPSTKMAAVPIVTKIELSALTIAFPPVAVDFMPTKTLEK
jgi:hypothetical protein